jgi:hypothetical protein
VLALGEKIGDGAARVRTVGREHAGLDVQTVAGAREPCSDQSKASLGRGNGRARGKLLAQELPVVVKEGIGDDEVRREDLAGCTLG